MCAYTPHKCSKLWCIGAEPGGAGGALEGVQGRLLRGARGADSSLRIFIVQSNYVEYTFIIYETQSTNPIIISPPTITFWLQACSRVTRCPIIRKTVLLGLTYNYININLLTAFFPLVLLYLSKPV